MCPCQQEQTGEKRPHHQPYRNIKRPIDRLEVQPGECPDIEIFSRLPEETDDDGRRKDGARGNLSVGQHPIDEKEEQDARKPSAELEKAKGDEVVDDVFGMAEEEPGEDSLLACSGGDRRHGKDTNCKCKT